MFQVSLKQKKAKFNIKASFMISAIITTLIIVTTLSMFAHGAITLAQESNSTGNKTNTVSTFTNRGNSTPFVGDIISLAKNNTDFRQEIKTANHTQVVLMSLKPGEDIGLEIHKNIDQILVFVQGNGEANINGQNSTIKEGTLAFVPAGTPHNFINTGNTDLKLYTTYSPPNHYAGTVQKTKAETKGYVPLGAEEELSKNPSQK
jgi:mannose-6-phosphate isomerase-like protein (cupin superfamily)